MTTRTDLETAAALSRVEDNINAALVVLGLPGVTMDVEIAAPRASGVRIRLPLNVANLTTLLNNRLTAVQTALTNLGVTG